MKVIVYLRAADVAKLAAEGHDPAAWVRDRVRASLDSSSGSTKVEEPPARPPAAPPPLVSTSKPGGCPMDVPRGTRCKVCGKSH